LAGGWPISAAAPAGSWASSPATALRRSASTPTPRCSRSRQPEAGSSAPTHIGSPLADASVDAAVTVATLEFTADPARILTEMARITRPGGRLVVAVLNPASPWGILDQPARRAPYASGCFVSRGELFALGRGHGKPSIHGALFAARRLPARQVLGPAMETAGRIAPRFGAFQVLTVITGTKGRAHN
jgi:SAM-dependent methyltransferase